MSSRKKTRTRQWKQKETIDNTAATLRAAADQLQALTLKKEDNSTADNSASLATQTEKKPNIYLKSSATARGTYFHLTATTKISKV